MNAALATGRTIYVAQGEVAVDDRPDVVITTLLGSCVSVCLFCPVSRLGGMNHILLPGDADTASGLGRAVNSMELLINPMLRRGARRARLQAKVFGGAVFSGAMGDIGERNIAFALGFLQQEGIRCTGQSVGGRLARKVEFWPSTGRARQKFVREVPDRRLAVAAPVPESGGIDLF